MLLVEHVYKEMSRNIGTVSWHCALMFPHDLYLLLRNEMLAIHARTAGVLNCTAIITCS